MTYGSATTAKNVDPYLNRIYKGNASKELVQDFENRYRRVGHSPLVEITKKQAVLLERGLGKGYIVRAGMRYSEPFIKDAVIDCQNAGAAKILGIILSPQLSSFIMEGYRIALIEAATQSDYSSDDILIAKEWYTEESFIELLSNRTCSILENLRNQYDTNIPVIFTTHSLPKRVVEKDPEYIRQIEATIKAIVTKMDDQLLEWHAGYQSAGHSPEEWLKPDLRDILTQLADKKTKAVLIVPIQFLTDHLEILYDLDIATKEQCEKFSIDYNRIEMPNTDPLFISALETVAKKSDTYPIETFAPEC